MCDCISEVNKQLSEHNAMLIITLLGNPPRVVIDTCKVHEKIRGKIPKMLASFCPFCGQPYQTQTDQVGVALSGEQA